MKRTNKLLAALTALVLGAALWQELRRAPQDRTWHGRIMGIPYEFRPPTAERLRATLWNKDNPSLLAPHAFGVGWSLNLYRLLHPRTSPA